MEAVPKHFRGELIVAMNTHVATGAERLEYLLSPTKDGIFIELAGVREGSGNLEFTPILGAFVKNEATETGGGANGTALTLWLNIRLELKKWRSKPSKSAIDKSVNGL